MASVRIAAPMPALKLPYLPVEIREMIFDHCFEAQSDLELWFGLGQVCYYLRKRVVDKQSQGFTVALINAWNKASRWESVQDIAAGVVRKYYRRLQPLAVMPYSGFSASKKRPQALVCFGPEHPGKTSTPIVSLATVCSRDRKFIRFHDFDHSNMQKANFIECGTLDESELSHTDPGHRMGPEDLEALHRLIVPARMVCVLCNITPEEDEQIRNDNRSGFNFPPAVSTYGTGQYQLDWCRLWGLRLAKHRHYRELRAVKRAMADCSIPIRESTKYRLSDFSKLTIKSD